MKRTLKRFTILLENNLFGFLECICVQYLYIIILCTFIKAPWCMIGFQYANIKNLVFHHKGYFNCIGSNKCITFIHLKSLMPFCFSSNM
jgi:hypothetical protein